jgi:hypothetical protein
MRFWDDQLSATDFDLIFGRVDLENCALSLYIISSDVVCFVLLYTRTHTYIHIHTSMLINEINYIVEKICAV